MCLVGGWMQVFQSAYITCHTGLSLTLYRSHLADDAAKSHAGHRFRWKLTTPKPHREVGGNGSSAEREREMNRRQIVCLIIRYCNGAEQKSYYGNPLRFRAAAAAATTEKNGRCSQASPDRCGDNSQLLECAAIRELYRPYRLVIFFSTDKFFTFTLCERQSIILPFAMESHLRSTGASDIHRHRQVKCQPVRYV